MNFFGFVNKNERIRTKFDEVPSYWASKFFLLMNWDESGI